MVFVVNLFELLIEYRIVIYRMKYKCTDVIASLTYLTLLVFRV